MPSNFDGPFRPTSMHHRFALTALAVIGPFSILHAQLLDGRSVGVNGTVHATVEDPLNEVVYVAGEFDRAGIVSPYAAVAATDEGIVQAGFPTVNAKVNTVIDDGAGGFYIGGTFTMVGGEPRNRLARINADGTLHPWDPDADNEVATLVALNGSIYAGGRFTQMGGVPHNYLVALDPGTGTPSTWTPEVNDAIRVLVTDGSDLYLAGDFTMLDDSLRSKLGGFTSPGHELLPWNPNVTGNVALCFTWTGTSFVVGGSFFTVGGQPRSNIAEVSITGSVTAWDPGSNGTVYALASDGTAIYAGGSFTMIGGATRERLAALDPLTGFATAWDPAPNVTVLAMHRDANGLWISGGFTQVGGQDRTFVALLDPVTGLATDREVSVDNVVRCFLDLGSDRVFLGGEFTWVGNDVRNNVAAFDLNTGALKAWDANVHGRILTITLADGVLYLGGELDAVADQPRTYVAAVQAADATPVDWAPVVDGVVRAIAVGDDGLAYIGGDFANAGGQARNSIAALDTNTGEATAFDPGTDGIVHAMTIQDGLLYVGGEFANADGQPRARLAAVEISTGDVTTWDPGADATVRTMLAAENALYVGGDFANAGGAAHAHTAALDPTSGAALPWQADADGSVYSLQHSSGTVYLGGAFSILGSATRNNIAAVSSITGAVQAWAPDVAGPVHSIALGERFFHAGGSFLMVDGLMRNGYAAYNNVALALGPVGSQFCAGDDIEVPFTVDGDVLLNNMFTAELSDANGSFAAPVTIGTLNGPAPGTISGTLPGPLVSGTDYRIRILTSGPQFAPSITGPITIDAPVIWYADTDNDGFGDPAVTVLSCAQPTDAVADATDCDDSDEAIYIGADCDDGIAGTVNDVWSEDCTCAGELTTGVPTTDASAALRAWPVPANTMLFLDQVRTGVVCDATGRILLSFNRTSTVDVSALSDGAYQLCMSDGAVLRFVKQ